MPILDPATGRPLPDSGIQRVLFVATGIHIYQIPPLTSNKGFSASTWTSPTQPTAQQIFVCRLRIIETSLEGKLKVDVVLEDSDSGNLFAAAPYTATAAVQQALDSSRFFAVRVQGEGGMKATLGIGFEDRNTAFDFGIALGDARKVLKLDSTAVAPSAARGAPGKAKPVQEAKQDFSLKEGEKIHISVGSKGRRSHADNRIDRTDDSVALFSIAPPPLPPPPAAKTHTEVHASPAPPEIEGKSAQELGFDDGDFGEFQ